MQEGVRHTATILLLLIVIKMRCVECCWVF